MTKPPKKVLAIISGTILLIAAVLIYHFGFPPLDKNAATTLSAIVLVGLALTVVFMGILALIYSVLGVENKDQPLGLPEGSVRALLAFSLVLIFVCLAAFLFSEINTQCDTCGQTLATVSETQLSDLKTNFRVAAEQSKDKSGKLLYEQIPDTHDPAGKATIDDLKHPLFSATYYPKQNTDASDFAKQIFTTLATVFVSVVSFYFGSSVTSSAVGAGAKAAGQTPDRDKKLAAQQLVLTNALADSHNAQIAVNQAKEKLKAAQDVLEVDKDPLNIAVHEAERALADAREILEGKRKELQSAQKTLAEATGGGADSRMIADVRKTKKAFDEAEEDLKRKKTRLASLQEEDDKTTTGDPESQKKVELRAAKEEVEAAERNLEGKRKALQSAQNTLAEPSGGDIDSQLIDAVRKAKKAFDEAEEDLKHKQDSLRSKRAEIEGDKDPLRDAKKALDEAQKNLLDKQAILQSAQKAVNESKPRGPDSRANPTNT